MAWLDVATPPAPTLIARKALIRIAVVWNIPVACNRAAADFMISSPLMADEYDVRPARASPDYS